jgi:hypothetical protein
MTCDSETGKVNRKTGQKTKIPKAEKGTCPPIVATEIWGNVRVAWCGIGILECKAARQLHRLTHRNRKIEALDQSLGPYDVRLTSSHIHFLSLSRGHCQRSFKAAGRTTSLKTSAAVFGA